MNFQILSDHSRRRSLFLLFLAISVLPFVLSSCGFGRQGTGVIVWASTSSKIDNGTIVWIWEQSRIRKTYKIQSEKGGDSFEIESWRVRFFNDEGTARQFAQTFAQLKNTWALSGKQGLPIRESADPNAPRVYKLAENEEVKVLSAAPQKVKQGNLEGTWMEVLTKDGYSGWVFDYYLRIVERVAGQKEEVKQSGPGDALLQKIVGETWYPEEFKAMIDQGRLNLTLFRPELGFRSTPGAFLIVQPVNLASPTNEEVQPAPDDRYSLPYTEAKKIDGSSYLFQGPNNLRVQFLDPELTRISVKFSWQGKEKGLIFVLLEQDVGTLVSQELASRQQKLATLLAHGSTLTSPTYGSIVVQPDGKLSWQGYEPLQPPSANLFPKDLKGTGTLNFDWFKDRKLMGDYLVAHFVMDREGGTFSQIFLYRFLKDGIQLLPVQDSELDKMKQTVLRESRTGLSLFFTFQK